MSKPSLSDFAAARAPKNQCWLCGIPERAEVDQARRDGVFMPVIRQWLSDVCGYQDVTRNRLEKHFHSGHHTEQAAS